MTQPICRQAEHLDKLDSPAAFKPQQPFSGEVTVLVGLYGRFRVTCYLYSATQINEEGYLVRTNNTHVTYDLGPGDVLVFDASYCYHYGDELERAAVRLHFSYRMLVDIPKIRPAVIDEQRSQEKLDQEHIYLPR